MTMVDVNSQHCARSLLYVGLQAAVVEFRNDISRDDFPQSRLEEVRNILAALKKSCTDRKTGGARCALTAKRAPDALRLGRNVTEETIALWRPVAQYGPWNPATRTGPINPLQPILRGTPWTKS